MILYNKVRKGVEKAIDNYYSYYILCVFFSLVIGWGFNLVPHKTDTIFTSGIDQKWITKVFFRFIGLIL